MTRYSIHPAAVDEIDAIVATITLDSPAVAYRWLLGLKERLLTLAAMPRMGRVRDDLLPGVHMFSYGNYLIFYSITDAAIEILHVIHGARDIKNLTQNES